MRTVLIICFQLISIILLAQQGQVFLQDGKYGLKDKDGQVLIENKYDEIAPFDRHLDLARALLNKKEYFIDRKGKLYQIAENISQLDKNTKAFTNNKAITDNLPSKLFEYPNLEILILKGKYHIPDDIKKLKKLKIVSIRQSRLEALPASFRKLSKLEILDISHNRFKQFPESITKLKKLKKLLAMSCHIKKLPEKLNRWKSLEYLDLNYNRLEILPDDLGKLKQLKFLNLFRNRLKSVPETIGKLKNLTSLQLSNNQLNGLPKGILKLHKLELLHLDYCKIKTFPEAFLAFKSLRALDLAGNQIGQLPINIGQLSKLQHLDMEGNNLRELPDSFGDLVNLEELSLDYNDLQFLPESFCRLVKLRRVWLSTNQIQRLPDGIGQLSNLEYLYVDFNRISSIPFSFKTLKKLKHVHLNGNPLSEATIDNFRFAMKYSQFRTGAFMSDFTEASGELFLFKKYQRAFEFLQQAILEQPKDDEDEQVETEMVFAVLALYVNQPALTIQYCQPIKQTEYTDDEEIAIFELYEAMAYLLNNQYSTAEQFFIKYDSPLKYASNDFFFDDREKEYITWHEAALLLINDLKAAGIEHPNFDTIREYIMKD